MAKLIFTDEQLKALGKYKKPVTKKVEDNRLIKVGVSKNGKGYMVSNRTAMFERQVKTMIYLLENKVTIKQLEETLDSIERINMGILDEVFNV